MSKATRKTNSAAHGDEPIPLLPVVRFSVGAGGIREVAFGPDDSIAEGDFEWLHFDMDNPLARQWLREETDLEDVTLTALLAQDTRPRCVTFGNGLLLNLRGVNLNPGRDFDDMIALKLFIQPGRLISLRGERVQSVDAVVDEIKAGRQLTGPYSLTTRVAWYLHANIAGALSTLHDRLDSVEEDVLDSPDEKTRQELVDLRRQSIILRRYLSPQQDALVRYMEAVTAFKDTLIPLQVQELADQVRRFVEDLDSIRDRTVLLQDEFIASQNDALNRNMYLLALVSLFFLPISFLTGLLGINLAGIPEAENPSAFGWFLGLLAVVGGVQASLMWWFMGRRR